MLQDTVRTPDNPVFYGIGNAVIDIYAEAETFQEPLKKDEFIHVENSVLDSILNSGIIEKMRTPGGSAVNTLKTAAHFGAQCFFSGSTGTTRRAPVRRSASGSRENTPSRTTTQRNAAPSPAGSARRSAVPRAAVR